MPAATEPWTARVIGDYPEPAGISTQGTGLLQVPWPTACPAPPTRVDSGGRERPVDYEIRVEGVLDQRWSAWFDGLQITSQPDGVTVIAGPVADQAALHGLLAKVRDLGLPLLSVDRIQPN